MLNKVLGLSLIGIIGIATICLITGFTQAAILDTVATTGNSIVPGKLDLKPTTAGLYSGSTSFYEVTAGGDQINGKVVFDNIAPGQSGTIKWVLENTGSIPGTLTINATVTFTDGEPAVEPESLFANNNGGGNGDLDEYLMVTLQIGQGTDQTAAEAAYTYIMDDSPDNPGSPIAISELETILNDQIISLAAAGGNDTLIYLLSWSLSDTDPDINIIQGNTAEIDIAFILSQ